MDRRDAKRIIRAIRLSILKRDRDRIHGTVEYACGCGAIIKVGLAEGVYERADKGLELAAPERIDCLFPDCDEEATIVVDSYDYAHEPVVAYLRVPSRRAAVDMANRCVVEAQLVVGH